MSSTYFRIQLTDKHLIVAKSVDIDCRKTTPSVSQKEAESAAIKIHNAVNGCSLYIESFIGLESVDWYESCNSFDVAGARIKKGERSVNDCSYTSNDIPKDWNFVSAVRYRATRRTTRPLTDALKALGVPSDQLDALVKGVQSMLKKNGGRAFIQTEMGQRYTGRGWSGNESYVKGCVVAESDY